MQCLTCPFAVAWVDIGVELIGKRVLTARCLWIGQHVFEDEVCGAVAEVKEPAKEEKA